MMIGPEIDYKLSTVPPLIIILQRFLTDYDFKIKKWEKY